MAERGSQRVPVDSGMSVGRAGAVIASVAGLYVVLFGTARSEWLWYALAAVAASGFFLWRSVSR